MTDVKGPWELVGTVVGIIPGFVIGYMIGDNVADYVQTLPQINDAVSYFVKEHPFLTEMYGGLTGGGASAVIGRISGMELDFILGTRED